MVKPVRLVIAFVFAVAFHQTLFSQSLSINTSGNPANASSILDVESTDKGMLVDNTGFVGVRTTGPLSYMDVNGSAGYAGNTITADLTLTELHHTIVILSSTAAGAGNITLPAASTCTRRLYVIVNQTGVAKNISSYDSLTGATATTIPATTSITLQSIGGLWYRIK